MFSLLQMQEEFCKHAVNCLIHCNKSPPYQMCWIGLFDLFTDFANIFDAQAIIKLSYIPFWKKFKPWSNYVGYMLVSGFSEFHHNSYRKKTRITQFMQLISQIIKTCSVNNVLNWNIQITRLKIDRRGGVEVERSPRVRKIGVRLPVATDLSRKNR